MYYAVTLQKTEEGYNLLRKGEIVVSSYLKNIPKPSPNFMNKVKRLEKLGIKEFAISMFNGEADTSNGAVRVLNVGVVSYQNR